MNKIAKSLIRKYGGETMSYRKLPVPAQAAMAFYMAVDGEAWDQAPGFTGNILKALPWYRKHYGHEQFGYVEIPTNEVIQAIWDADEDLHEEFDSAEAWIEWYRQYVLLETHPRKNRWPVILSDHQGEFLQDGWHRLSDYINQGAKVIPAMYYVG